MGADELTAWVRIFELMGPFAPVGVMIAFLLYSTSKREKTPSENVTPVSRAEHDRLADEVRELAAAVNQMKGALGVK
jgi:hypothetical protein